MHPGRGHWVAGRGGYLITFLLLGSHTIDTNKNYLYDVIYGSVKFVKSTWKVNHLNKYDALTLTEE